MQARVSRSHAVAIALLAALAVAGCASSNHGDPTAPPSTTPGPGVIILQHTPANAACDTLAVDYRSVTFFLDPTAETNVWAVTDRGARLAVLWDASFVGGPVLDPSVKDKTGAIVVRNRDVLQVPQGAFPNLHGHFACPSTSSLWVFDAPPE